MLNMSLHCRFTVTVYSNYNRPAIELHIIIAKAALMMQIKFGKDLHIKKQKMNFSGSVQ